MSIDACDANGRDSIACRARVPRLLLDGAGREPGDDVALREQEGSEARASHIIEKINVESMLGHQ